MKGGLAVMLDLARSLESPQIDCTYVFYAREEVARAESGLIEVQTSRPDLLACDVAIVLEPTNAIIEAGCQGVVRVEVCVRGVRAHSARPWVGTNAIHRMGKVLDLVSGFPEREPEIDGVTYHETLQAVGVEGGVAGNVIPDLARLTLSHRFAPDRTTDDALDALVGYLAPVIDPELGDTITVIDRAPSAPPGLGHPVIAALIDASGAAPVAKTAWTDVARFAERGTPAANFGPGDPLVAHSPGEFVVAEEIARVADALRAVLG
jgi:succinyl-diaminopimelate desuccinylase